MCLTFISDFNMFERTSIPYAQLDSIALWPFGEDHSLAVDTSCMEEGIADSNIIVFAYSVISYTHAEFYNSVHCKPCSSSLTSTSNTSNM